MGTLSNSYYSLCGKRKQLDLHKLDSDLVINDSVGFA